MRLVIALALPVGLISLLATLTILNSWANGGNLCETWMSVALPYCDPAPHLTRT